MSKGFLWFAQNNDKVDYVELSITLAKSIKRCNKNNKVCVVTDQSSKFSSELVDVVKVMGEDASAEHDIKWANEYKAFQMTPFTHTIKLEADMLWTINTDCIFFVVLFDRFCKCYTAFYVISSIIVLCKPKKSFRH